MSYWCTFDKRLPGCYSLDWSSQTVIDELKGEDGYLDRSKVHKAIKDYCMRREMKPGRQSSARKGGHDELTILSYAI